MPRPRKPRKLSKQQKLILESLWSRKASSLWPAYLAYISGLSWKVAEEFNTGHKDRIWDGQEQKKQVMEKTMKEIQELTGEDGNFPDDEARKKGSNLHLAALQIFRLIDGLHRKQKLLTQKHRASFSRSLKRLEERELIERFVDLKTEWRDEGLIFSYYVGDGKTRYIHLTEKGFKACKTIFPNS